jgi:hypothetical protein
MHNFASERRRFGYRRRFILLRQVGERSGINRVERLYREESLTVLERQARRRAVATLAPIAAGAAADAQRSVDFVHDQHACCRRFRILNIIDGGTRKRLASIPDNWFSVRLLALELTALIARRGEPSMIVSVNCNEFTLNAKLVWAHDNMVVWHFLVPES